MATVLPISDFHPDHDAEILHKAMKGMGTDERKIISLLTRRSNEQRVAIAHAYESKYNKDLDNVLKKELSGDFEKIILAMITPKYKYIAQELQGAFRGMGTNEAAVIQILCPYSRLNAEMEKIATAFEHEYKRTLEAALKSEVKGNFLALLEALVSPNRHIDEEIDEAKAKIDAKKLKEAGIEQEGTDDSEFRNIFTTRDFSQLRETFKEYREVADESIISSLKKEMKGDLQAAYLALVECIKNTPKYFAKQLFLAMKGFGTKEKSLTRIIVLRSEIDLKLIKTEYANKYKRLLRDDIAKETSGDYQKTLLALLGE